MSTSTELEQALRYARPKGKERQAWAQAQAQAETEAQGQAKLSSLIFRILADSGVNTPADIQMLSAFPQEKECLYPPLTYLQPTGEQLIIKRQHVKFVVIDVRPG